MNQYKFLDDTKEEKAQPTWQVKQDISTFNYLNNITHKEKAMGRKLSSLEKLGVPNLAPMISRSGYLANGEHACFKEKDSVEKAANIID